MDIWTLLLMSIGLAMDAFAVSVSSGIVLCHTCWRQTVSPAVSACFRA